VYLVPDVARSFPAQHARSFSWLILSAGLFVGPLALLAAAMALNFCDVVASFGR
jgi:hypothetical protein